MERLETFPIHEYKSFITECCDLINSEWPRTKAARLQSLQLSSENFPASLILVLNGDEVVGHVKLSELKLNGPDIMLESMIIRKDHRGKGWGKFLMEAAEKYVESKGKARIYLSTRGQEGFYKKVGYEICEPILYFGYCAWTPKTDEKTKMYKVQQKNNLDIKSYRERRRKKLQRYTVMVKNCKKRTPCHWWINLQNRLNLNGKLKSCSKVVISACGQATCT